MRVARGGVTEFVPEITEEMLVAGIPDPDQLALVRKLDLRSIIIAPLRARTRTFGTITLANSGSSRLFEQADVQLAEELARRAATSIDNARLYTERTHIAHTLQARLLPARLPEIPGAVLAARYRAAGELNEVGGDFYDVFPRSADEWAMVVGDVSGKGPEAAAVTALARYTLRAGALDDDAPEKALRRLNVAMRTARRERAVRHRRARLPVDRRRRPDQRPPVARRPPAGDGRPPRRDGRQRRDATATCSRSPPTRPSARAGSCSTRATCCCSTPTGSPRPARATGRSASSASSSCSARSRASRRRRSSTRSRQAVVDAHEGEPRDDIALLATRRRWQRCLAWRQRSASRGSLTHVSFERTPVMSSTRPTRSPGATNATGMSPLRCAAR